MMSEIKITPHVRIDPNELKGDEYTVSISDDLGATEFSCNLWHLKELQKRLNKMFEHENKD